MTECKEYGYYSLASVWPLMTRQRREEIIREDPEMVKANGLSLDDPYDDSEDFPDMIPEDE